MAVGHEAPDLGGGAEEFPSSDDDSSGFDSADSLEYSEDCDDEAYGTMARFVPTLVLERLRSEGETAMMRSTSSGADAKGTALRGLNSPKVHELDAAVMVVDVSGFSSMCEAFAQGFIPNGGWRARTKGLSSLQAPVGKNGVRRIDASHASRMMSLYRHSNDKEIKSFGAEGVRDALNAALGSLISTVERFGGDVLRIAGDALIVLFHQGEVRISPAEMTELCAACTRCGWDCITSSGVGSVSASTSVSGNGRASTISVSNGSNEGLSVHVGVGCGRVSCFHVGSDELGWQLVVSGELFEGQVAKALNASRAGEIAVSAEVWQRLAGTGWGSSPVRAVDGGSASGLRLLRCTPQLEGSFAVEDWGNESDEGVTEEDPCHAGDGETSTVAPAHGAAGVFGSAHAGSPPRHPSRESGRRLSLTSVTELHVAAAAAAAAAGDAGNVFPAPAAHTRAASLEVVATTPAGTPRSGSRWCPSRRRPALLEEVETGVLPMLSKEVGRALKGYCPQPIREGLVAERLGLLAELQRVAVLFVGLDFKGVGTIPLNSKVPANGAASTPSANNVSASGGNDSTPSPAGGAWSSKRQARAHGHGSGESHADGAVTQAAVDALDFLQASFSLLQTTVANHGGVIKELSVDDKGTVLVAGFGLSPYVGRLPAARATLCAMECTDRLRERSLARCHAGVATGHVFCGSLGSDNRREFAMISDTVNLAGRLMNARKKRRLLCKTQATRTLEAPEHVATSSRPTLSFAVGGDSLKRPGPKPYAPSSVGGTYWSWRDTRDEVVVPGARDLRGASKTNGMQTEHGSALKSSLRSTRPAASKMLQLTPPQPASQRKVPGLDETGDGTAPAANTLEEPFNRWVVLEAETLREARKSQKLAFLELEAIEVKGKTSKVPVYAPGLAEDLAEAINSPAQPTAQVRSGLSAPASSIPAAPPHGIIFGRGSGGSLPAEFGRQHGGRASDSPFMFGSRVDSVVTDRQSAREKDPPDDSKRYRLDSPRTGEYGGGERRGDQGEYAAERRGRRRSSGKPAWRGRAYYQGGPGQLSLTRSISLPETNKRVVPDPDAAARGMASWLTLRGGAGIAGEEIRATPGAPGTTGSRVARVYDTFHHLEAIGIPGSGGAGEVLSREAFEALLPCIFHAEAVHDEISHILWARTGGRVTYLADLCRTLVGISGRGPGASGGSFGEVGEDGTWRLRLNEFAHVLKLASRVPPGTEGAIQRRLDELPYMLKQVVLRVICVTVVAGAGEIDLLLHLLTSVAHFKEYWKAVVSQQTRMVQLSRRRNNRRRSNTEDRRSSSTSPVPARRSPDKVQRHSARAGAGDEIFSSTLRTSMFSNEQDDQVGRESTERRRVSSDVQSLGATPEPGRSRSRTERFDASPSPTQPRATGRRSGLETLLACLRMLEARRFVRVCDGEKIFICDDVMLVDQVYATTPFKHRKALHKEAAQWISDRHRQSFRDRAEVMPVLISHLAQAHEEARAQAMLAVLKVMGGRFLDRWVLKHVRPLVAIREYPRNPTASEHLALCVLPALPSLRGLAKAIRGAEIAGVMTGVALRLRSLRFKGTEKRTDLRHRRSASISGVSFRGSVASTRQIYSCRLDRVSSESMSRRSKSLAGGLAPSASELALPIKLHVGGPSGPVVVKASKDVPPLAPR